MPYFTIVGTSRLTGERKIVRGVKAKDSHQAVNQSRSQFDGLYWHFFIRLSKHCHVKSPSARTIKHLGNTQRRSAWAVLAMHYNQRSKADVKGDSGFRSLIKELLFQELSLPCKDIHLADLFASTKG